MKNLPLILACSFAFCLPAGAQDAVTEGPTMTERLQRNAPHSPVAPQKYPLEQSEPEVLSADTSRQYVHGTQSTLTKWTFKAGASVGMHYHPVEQVSWIVSGQAIVTSNGNTYTLNAGDVLIIPPNVPHEFAYPVDTVNVDFFSPQRQDWIDGETTYLPEE